MTDLERRVREALDTLAAKQGHATPQPQEPPQHRPAPRVAPARREAPRPTTPATPSFWGRQRTRAALDYEARFADAPDAMHPGRTVRVFVFTVETVNGTELATVIRQDNKQRFTVAPERLTNVSDNA